MPTLEKPKNTNMNTATNIILPVIAITCATVSPVYAESYSTDYPHKSRPQAKSFHLPSEQFEIRQYSSKNAISFLSKEEMHVRDIISMLEKFKSYENNWDGCGSLKPAHESIDIAKKIVPLFKQNNLTFDIAIPMPYGGLQFELFGNKNELQINIENSKEISITVFNERSDEIYEENFGSLQEITSKKIIFIENLLKQ